MYLKFDIGAQNMIMHCDIEENQNGLQTNIGKMVIRKKTNNVVL